MKTLKRILFLLVLLFTHYMLFAQCGTTDSDNDGIFDLCDLDDDNDGIPDTVELGTLISTEQQPCGGDTPLDFSTAPSLISGTDLLQGAVYRFPNISTGMDAIVTIVETNNATVVDVDRNVTTPGSFKPRTGFNFTNVGEFGYIEYRIQFVNSGGTTPQTINKFFMNFNDLDGSISYSEQNWAYNPKTYTIDNPTEVTMNTDGSWIVATGAINDYPPSTNEMPNVNFAVNYTNKTEISIRVGAVARVAGASSSARSHSIEFNCVTNYVAPETYSLDQDYDGLSNHLDLDSDNDGILDAVESGHGQSNTNGVLAGPYGANGLSDSVETSSESGIINYTITDTDGIDGSNYLDSDSDNDYCYDAFEGSAGYSYNDVSITTGQLISSIDANGIPGGTSQGIGTSIDALTQAAICLAESTLDFDGIDDYVDSDFDFSGMTQTTAMAWIKLDPAFINTAIIFDQTSLNLKVNGSFKISTKVNSGGTSLSSTPTLDRNKWYHVALIFDSTLSSDNLKVYLNGELIDSDTHSSLTSPISASADKFTIGKEALSADQFFKGAIDEVRVFKSALTEDQLRQIIHQEIENNSGSVKGKVIPKNIVDLKTSLAIPWTDLEVYYPMSNISGSRTLDQSDYGNDATLHNITSLQPQTAPMPYQTVSDGDWSSTSTWLNGSVWDIQNPADVESWAIYEIDNIVSVSQDVMSYGLIINDTKKLTVTGDNEINNSWYLELNGTLDLQGDSQLVQGLDSDLVTDTDGKVLRRQEGNTNRYWYNYWSSPVGSLSATTLTDNNTEDNNINNTPFKLNMLKDSDDDTFTFSTNWNNMVEGVISSYWLYTFQNGLTYNNWVSIDETSPIQTGFGYTQKGTGNTVDTEQQYIFEGKPNNGTILIDATDVVGDAGITTESVQNVTMTTTLIGNPYPSALDAKQFIADNSSVIQGTILLWEQWAGSSHYLAEYEGGYGFINNTATARAYQHADIPLAVNGQGIKTPTFYIPVGQGFFVEVVEDGDIEFNNGQRVFIKENDADSDPTNNSVFFRNSEEQTSTTNTETTAGETQILRLEFGVSSGASRSFVLGFSEDATDGLDYGLDGGLITTPPADDMGSLLNGQQYVIQTFAPYTSDKEIDLVLHASGNFTYTLKSTEISNFPADQDLFIKDNLTGVHYDLRNAQAYNFTSDAGTYTNRFQVVFQDPSTLSNDEFTNDSTLIYVNQLENMLYAKNLTDQAKQVIITNMLGQTIKTYSNIDNHVLNNGISISDLSSGIYIVSVQTDNNQTINKKIILD